MLQRQGDGKGPMDNHTQGTYVTQVYISWRSPAYCLRFFQCKVCGQDYRPWSLTDYSQKDPGLSPSSATH